MTRTVGAAIGALIVVLFLNHIATPTPSVTVSWSAATVVVTQQ